MAGCYMGNRNDGTHCTVKGDDSYIQIDIVSQLIYHFDAPSYSLYVCSVPPIELHSSCPGTMKEKLPYQVQRV